MRCGISKAVMAVSLAAVLAVAGAALATGGVSCAGATAGEDTLVFYPAKGTKVVNAEGKTMTLGKEGFSGNMNRISEYYRNGIGMKSVWSVQVPESARYKLSSTDAWVQLDVTSAEDSGAQAWTDSGCDGVEVARSGGRDWKASVSGARGAVGLDVWRRGGPAFFVDGKCRGDCELESDAGGAVLKGMKGLVEVEASTYEGGDPGVSGRFYLRGGASRAHRVSLSGGKLGVSGAWRVKEGSSDHVDGLVARHSETAGTTFLTWNKVRGAKSYRVYRWDEASNCWRAAALRKGKSGNWYAAKAGGGVARFRVRAYRSRAGKGAVGRASAEVWLSEGGAPNASSVSVAKRSLRLRAGESARLAADVAARSGARPLTGRVRWYSSDPKVASVGRDTGQVRARSKGRCEVWAKAHDGVNSKRVKVTVR